MKIIAIDPAIRKGNSCGFCVYDTETLKITEIKSFNFGELITYLYDLRDCISFTSFKIIFEDSNAKKSNWHGASARGNVGKNKGVCLALESILDSIEFDYEKLPPTGYTKYFVNKYDFKVKTGFKKSFNGDARAAVAMIYKNYKVIKNEE